MGSLEESMLPHDRPLVTCPVVNWAFAGVQWGCDAARLRGPGIL